MAVAAAAMAVVAAATEPVAAAEMAEAAEAAEAEAEAAEAEAAAEMAEAAEAAQAEAAAVVAGRRTLYHGGSCPKELHSGSSLVTFARTASLSQSHCRKSTAHRPAGQSNCIVHKPAHSFVCCTRCRRLDRVHRAEHEFGDRCSSQSCTWCLRRRRRRGVAPPPLLEVA